MEHYDSFEIEKTLYKQIVTCIEPYMHVINGAVVIDKVENDKEITAIITAFISDFCKEKKLKENEVRTKLKEIINNQIQISPGRPQYKFILNILDKLELDLER